MQDNHSIKTVEIQFANAQLLPEIVKLLEEGHTVPCCCAVTPCARSWKTTETRPC